MSVYKTHCVIFEAILKYCFVQTVISYSARHMLFSSFLYKFCSAILALLAFTAMIYDKIKQLDQEYL